MPDQRIPWKRLLAEFFVIVIGVLVALAADSWREGLQDRADEAEYLARLRADLVADTVALGRTQRRLEQKFALLEGLSSDPRRFSTDSLAEALAAATTWSWDFTAENSVTFDEMRGAGRIGLIGDADLRATISQYYAVFENDLGTIRARVPTFNALTYRLVPRPERSDSVFGEDYQAGELSPAHLALLQAPDVLEEIRVGATAELNFSRFSAGRALSLYRNATHVIDRIDEDAAR